MLYLKREAFIVEQFLSSFQHLTKQVYRDKMDLKQIKTNFRTVIILYYEYTGLKISTVFITREGFGLLIMFIILI